MMKKTLLKYSKLEITRKQNNLTNKFIRTFRRLEKHNKNIKITMYPYELDKFITIEVDNNKKENKNKLLEETSKDIEKCKSKKI